MSHLLLTLRHVLGNLVLIVFDSQYDNMGNTYNISRILIQNTTKFNETCAPSLASAASTFAPRLTVNLLR